MRRIILQLHFSRKALAQMGSGPVSEKRASRDLAEKVFDARHEAALYVIPRKVTVEAVGQSFLLPEDYFLLLETYLLLNSLAAAGVEH